MNQPFSSSPPESLVRETSDTGTLTRRVLDCWPLEKWDSVKTVIAVSGGADSVALLRILAGCATSPCDRLVVAHVNHGIRGRESDADEKFVESLSEKLGLTFQSRKLNLNSQTQTGPDSSVVPEASLRTARYAALMEIAIQTGARYLATAHTRDDQAETVLLRLFRGTGPAGLAGIPQIRVVDESVSIIRPLLTTSRAELESCLSTLQQDFRTDSSNSNTVYNRNFLRHRILPEVQEKFGRDIDVMISRLATQQQEQQDFIRHVAAQFQADVHVFDDRIEIDCRRLRTAHSVAIRQVLVDAWKSGLLVSGPLASGMAAMNYEHWNRMAGMVKSAYAAPVEMPGAIRVRREGHNLIIRKP